VEVLDCRTATTDVWLHNVRAALSTGPGTVVLRHLDLLPAEILPNLLAELRPVAEHSGDRPGPRLVATTRLWTSAPARRTTRPVRRHVTVPPLRHRPDDLRDIVPVLLTRLRPRDPVCCAPGL